MTLGTQETEEELHRICLELCEAHRLPYPALKVEELPGDGGGKLQWFGGLTFRIVIAERVVLRCREQAQLVLRHELAHLATMLDTGSMEHDATFMRWAESLGVPASWRRPCVHVP